MITWGCLKAFCIEISLSFIKDLGPYGSMAKKSRKHRKSQRSKKRSEKVKKITPPKPVEIQIPVVEPQKSKAWMYGSAAIVGATTLVAAYFGSSQESVSKTFDKPEISIVQTEEASPALGSKTLEEIMKVEPLVPVNEYVPFIDRNDPAFVALHDQIRTDMVKMGATGGSVKKSEYLTTVSFSSDQKAVHDFRDEQIKVMTAIKKYFEIDTPFSIILPEKVSDFVDCPRDKYVSYLVGSKGCRVKFEGIFEFPNKTQPYKVISDTFVTRGEINYKTVATWTKEDKGQITIERINPIILPIMNEGPEKYHCLIEYLHYVANDSYTKRQEKNSFVVTEDNRYSLHLQNEIRLTESLVHGCAFAARSWNNH
jgi:hypothetical protein